MYNKEKERLKMFLNKIITSFVVPNYIKLCKN